ncbi:mechanosensitive ion channel family protein [Propionivibrio dicarboxylicus]|uniref:Small-conductance mechanosensitive channel n=1 Tax=Propionivibrio dicarboxylicus TaxID=83767 RepID=A0A1G8GDV5_9RHOO|nr:mechanosensitive ion channel family protein [Propionivibrio dicarboxylicus]SDH92584.1 small conductance mechanosensitive channel [Propionivibrio dicarboxylicus]
MNEQLRTLDHFKVSAIDMAVRFGPKLVVALVILFIGHLLGRWVGRLVERLLVRLKFEAPVRVLLVRTAHLIVFGFFIIMALQNLGVELLPLIAGLGVAGAGVALAMQGILGNVAAGLTIIFTRPFHVGDYLSIGTEEGEVLDVTLFSTTLGHTDRSKVIIPNRKIVGEIMHNYSNMRQLDLVVGVAYDTNLEAAFRLINGILSANPRVLPEPAPVVAVSQLAEFAVAISVRPWVRVPDYVAASGEINRAILETFRAEGVEIPVPQQEVRMLGA